MGGGARAGPHGDSVASRHLREDARTAAEREDRRCDLGEQSVGRAEIQAGLGRSCAAVLVYANLRADHAEACLRITTILHDSSRPCYRRAARSVRVRGRPHSQLCDRRRRRPPRRRAPGAVGSNLGDACADVARRCAIAELDARSTMSWSRRRGRRFAPRAPTPQVRARLSLSSVCLPRSGKHGASSSATTRRPVTGPTPNEPAIAFTR